MTYYLFSFYVLTIILQLFLLCNNVKHDLDAGDAVIILVGEEKTEPAAPQTGDTSPVEIGILTEPIAQVHDGGRSSAEIGEPVGWEIVKSIVYGGLIESITSLGIVSSAASSGAAPCKCSFSLIWKHGS